MVNSGYIQKTPVFNKIIKVLQQDVSILARPNEVKALLLNEDKVQDKFFDLILDGDVKGVELAIKQGASITMWNTLGFSALHLCVKKDLHHMLGVLIKNSPKTLLEVKNEDGFTALHDACVGEKLECVKVLLDGGFDSNVKNSNGSTSLHLAATIDNPRLLRLLHEAGASWDIEDQSGKTPLQVLEFYRPHAVNSWKRRAG